MMELFDKGGNFSGRNLLNYAKDLATVQAVRLGVDVPLERIDAVENVGECMVALEEGEIWPS